MERHSHDINSLGEIVASKRNGSRNNMKAKLF